MYPIDYDAALRLLTECVQLPTVNPPGNEKLAADWLAEELERKGFSPRVDDLGGNRANIVTVLRGTGEKPALVFNGHLDVVPVGDTPWTHDPFGGVRVNGRLYGRGTSDMKSGLMAMVMAVDALKQAGVHLKGDLILSGVADEETGALGANHGCRPVACKALGPSSSASRPISRCISLRKAPVGSKSPPMAKRHTGRCPT
jgi:succinyl-diaminopimelate desuccinylase